MTRAQFIAFLQYSWTLTQGRVLSGALVTLLVGLTESLSLILLIPIVAAASPENAGRFQELPIIGDWLAAHTPSLTILLIVFVGLIALQAWLTRFKNLYNQKILHDAADRMRIKLFGHIGMAKWSAIRAKRMSDINHNLKDDSNRTIGAIRNLLTLFQSVSMLVIYLIVAALVSWQMAIFAAVVGTILFAALYPIRRRASSYGREMTRLHEDQNRTILEFIGGLHLAKLYTSEDQHLDVYRDHLKRTRKSVIDFLALSTWGTFAFQIGAAIIAAIFVWLSISVFKLDIARLTVLMVIFIRLAPRFNVIQDTTQQFLTNAPAFLNYKSALTYFEAAQERDPDILAIAPPLNSTIRLKNVSVAFDETESPALNNVSFDIPAGQITALIGPSGSGKSTLADLVLGLTEPDSGSVEIDGEALTEANHRAWRASVASVPQDAFLMNDTIAANLRVGRADASHDEIWEALDRANIADFVRGLPDGLETVAQERGQRFSGGERQRLALARALLRRPKFLVLDEATSALDWENQRSISDAIAALRGTLTCLIIAHRPSLITHADQVIAMEEGHVAETGSFAELRANKTSALSKMVEGDRSD